MSSKELLTTPKEIKHSETCKSQGMKRRVSHRLFNLPLPFHVQDIQEQNSEFETSIKKAEEALEVEKLISTKQVHSSVVIEVDASYKERQEADGMITSTPNIALGVFTADCIPLLLFDRNQSTICALHCGWRGIAGGIIENAVAKFGKADIRYIMGPSISQSSYRVDEEYVEHFCSIRQPSKSFFISTSDGWLFDLRGYAASVLHELGCRAEITYALDTCTSPTLYPSCRRAQNQGLTEPIRMLSAIALHKV